MTTAASHTTTRERPAPRTTDGAPAERLPPQSLEAEMSLLGSMMLSREAVGEVVPVIAKSEARWLYRPDHQTLFETLIDLYDANQPIDLVILRNELQRRSVLEQVGGVEYLVSCAESVPTHVNAEYYARIVRDKGILRDLIRCVGEVSERAYADADDTSVLLDWAEQKLFSVTERRISTRSVQVGELLRSIYDQILSSEEGHLTGVPSGFFELDEMTGGLQSGDMLIVAGRPSMGKTALGLNMAEYLAVEERRPVAFFSMEMSRQQVAQRIICSRAQIDSQRFRRRMLNEKEKHQVAEVCGLLQDAPLYIDDTPGMSIMELRAKARRLTQQYQVQAIFVDYLQLMQAPGEESRQQEISAISRGLKALGRELQVPIVAMAQLNRMAEGREGHRPRMSDLRESGAIEQDADVVLLIHREEYYRKDDETVKNKAELIVAKQRNGPTGQVDLVFDHQFTRFHNFSPVADPGYVAPMDDETPF